MGLLGKVVLQTRPRMRWRLILIWTLRSLDHPLRLEMPVQRWKKAMRVLMRGRIGRCGLRLARCVVRIVGRVRRPFGGGMTWGIIFVMPVVRISSGF